jgi:hypothetical protein
MAACRSLSRCQPRTCHPLTRAVTLAVPCQAAGSALFVEGLAAFAQAQGGVLAAKALGLLASASQSDRGPITLDWGGVSWRRCLSRAGGREADRCSLFPGTCGLWLLEPWHPRCLLPTPSNTSWCPPPPARLAQDQDALSPDQQSKVMAALLRILGSEESQARR